nr:hypothetical protein [Tanacetum cinerariifolium]
VGGHGSYERLFGGAHFFLGPRVAQAVGRFGGVQLDFGYLVGDGRGLPVEAHGLGLAAAVEEGDGPLAAGQGLEPGFEAHLAVGERGLGGRAHAAQVVAGDERGGHHGPHREVGAVFVGGHAVADFQHVGVVPVAGAGVLAQVLLLVHNLHHTKRLPGAVVLDAVEAVVDVARGAPEVAHGGAPLPGLVVAPLTDAEHHRSPGLAQG